MNTKEVKTAVIPAAGLGTRMLPIAHAVPKEMLPIVDRPAISYLVEEVVNSGIEDILIITNRDKDAIEDYFDNAPEYEERLRASGKIKELKYIDDTAHCANIYFLRQHEAKGLGHAVRRAKTFTGSDPFCVVYGDDVVKSKTPVCKQLIDVYHKYGKAVAGVKPVSDEQIKKYCSLGVTEIEKGIYNVYDMIEKPQTKEQVMSNLSILGRVLLVPEVYDILDEIPYGAGNELQLTDAMAVMARSTKEGGMTALEFEGKRYDMGSKLGFFIANVDNAILSSEFSEEAKQYLLDVVKNNFNIELN